MDNSAVARRKLLQFAGASSLTPDGASAQGKDEKRMNLGSFSIGLTVKELVKEADEKGSGPASFVAVDPDGNQILVDQHV